MSRQEKLAVARQTLAAIDRALDATRAACAMIEATGSFRNGAEDALTALMAQRLTAVCYVVDAEYKAGVISADEFYSKMGALDSCSRV